MGVHRTCGEPDEIKKNTHPKNVTALFRDQEPCVTGSMGGNRITITGTGFATFDPVAEANGQSRRTPHAARRTPHAACCGLRAAGCGRVVWFACGWVVGWLGGLRVVGWLGAGVWRCFVSAGLRRGRGRGVGERPVGARQLSTTGVFPLARRRAACAAGQASGADADAVVGVTVAAAGCKVDSRTDTEIVCTPSADPGAAAAQGPFAKGVGSVAQRWVANAGKEFKGDWSVASDSTETMIGQLFGTRQEYCTDGVHENKMVGTTWKDFTRTGSSCWYARHMPSAAALAERQA